MSATILLALRIILIAVLFGFIGWAFWLLWRDLRLQSATLTRPRLPSIQLTRKEADLPQTVIFTRLQVLVGRDPAAELYLEDKTISARHARLYFEDTQWWVEDLGSTNGTLLNQERVVEPVVLASGDRLQFGQVAFSLIIPDQNST
jgi:pSer/pThr/pTyr-binding forkhead associated (FHA) protein